MDELQYKLERFVQNRTCPIKYNPTCYGSQLTRCNFTSNCSLPLLFEKFLHPQGLLGLAKKQNRKAKKKEFRLCII